VVFENSKGNKLSGTLSNPTNNVNCPVIILCHGLNSGKNSTSNLELEKIFSKHGIASFRFDFFAHGESEGKFEDRTLEEFVDDVLKAIEYLKNQNYKKIGIYGASFGGVAAVVAASRNSDLKVMALKAVGMGHTSRKMSNYKNDFDTKTWIKAGEYVKIPTIIVHGSADEDVEIQLAKELAKSIKTSKLEIFDGADHRFSKKEDFERMIKDISEFIIKNI
jgi:hypothetical protein